MKALLAIAVMLLLCSCASEGQVHSSFDYNGQTMPGMNLTDPHFYMDDDKPASGLAAPLQPHAVGGLCTSDCQSRGGSADYCDRACAF